MKKILAAAVLLMVAVLTACGQKEKNIEGTLPEIMEKVYAGTEDDMPALVQTEVTEENKAYYLGTEDVHFKEAIASEPMINAIAHSVVLVRLEEGEDAAAAAEKIKESAQPNKWICVGVDPQNVYTETKGDIVILIMDDIKPDKLLENFKAL